MKQILSVSVKARYPLHSISDLWAEFNRQFGDNPTQELYRVGTFTDWQGAATQTQEVWVRLNPDRTEAVMAMSNDI